MQLPLFIKTIRDAPLAGYLAFLLFIILPTGSSLACSCGIPDGYQDYFRKSLEIYEVEILQRVRSSPDPSSPYFLQRAVITKAWRGIRRGEVDLLVDPYCTTFLRIGERVAIGTHDSRLRLSTCIPHVEPDIEFKSFMLKITAPQVTSDKTHPPRTSGKISWIGLEPSESLSRSPMETGADW